MNDFDFTPWIFWTALPLVMLGLFELHDITIRFFRTRRGPSALKTKVTLLEARVAELEQKNSAL